MVVKLLLARDNVNPDKPTDDDRTPLWTATYNGHAAVVKLLLTRDDLNLDKPNNQGQTPLWCACYKRHVGVVKLLTERRQSQQATQPRPNTTLDRLF